MRPVHRGRPAQTWTPTRALIQDLGGNASVARAIGQRPATISNWAMRDDIPGEHRIAIWRLATTLGVRWTPPGMAGFSLAAAEP